MGAGIFSGKFVHDNIKKDFCQGSSFKDCCAVVVVFKKMANKRPQIITLALFPLAANAVIVIHRAALE